MQVFYVRAESLADPGVEATAFVIAEDPDEAVLLLRKDVNFSGYRLPPVEMTALDASRISVREALGDTAPTEKGVYSFIGKQAPAGAP